MRAREAVALFAAGAALTCTIGCGATFNGTSRSITVRSSTPGAEVYINGGLAGPAPATFVTGNAAAQTVTVRAPGFEDKDIALVPTVKAGGIVCDILWSLTIIGVAAPISDALLGTFKAVEPGEINVALASESAKGPTNVREFKYSPGDVVIAPVAAPVAASAPVAPAKGPPGKPCKTRFDCKGGMVCSERQCVAPSCKADKECGAGKVCSAAGTCEANAPKK